MIEIKSEAKRFANVIDYCSSITNETDFVFKPDGMFVKCIHPSNTCMGEITLTPDFFDKYEVDKDYILTINMELLKKIVKKLGKKMFSIGFTENEIVFKEGSREYMLKYYVGKEEERTRPEFEFDTALRLSVMDFFGGVEEAQDLSELVKLQFTNNKDFNLLFKGNMVSGENLIETVSGSGMSECWYDLNLLLLFKNIKNIRKDGMCDLMFGNNSPVSIHVKDDGIEMWGLLAQRVEDVNE